MKNDMIHSAPLAKYKDPVGDLQYNSYPTIIKDTLYRYTYMRIIFNSSSILLSVFIIFQ